MLRIPAIFCLLATGVLGSVARGDDAKLPAAVEEVLQWLPVNTESLIVAQGPFALQELNGREADLGQVMRSQSFWLIGQFLEEAILKKLDGQQIVVAVEGSRRFRAPKPRGIMPFEGCQILRFDEGAHEALRKVFREYAEETNNTILLSGKKVVVLKKTENDEEWNLYLALPQNGVLLCATDRDYLKILLLKIGGNAEERALPRGLPEWQHVNLKAPVWAIRHYSRDTAADDPSSPFHDKAPPDLSDPKAIGFTWSLEEESKTVRIHYLSQADNAREIATRRWHHPDEGLTSVPGPAADGVVEITSQNRNEDGLYKLFLLLLATMGHAFGPEA